jgi:hypothetical protein
MIILDFIFGWLLRLPSDLTILALALLTGGVLTLVRKWTSNQELLARAAADNKRLAILIKEAKRAGNKEALARFRLTKAQVGMLKFKQEGKPLLVSLVPIALLATWALARLEFLPPQPGETISAVATAPVSAAGEVVYLVPAEMVKATDGWVKQFAVTGNEATARWQLQFASAEKAGQLIVRRATGGAAQLKLELRERRLFGIVPGLPRIGLPAWLVGYLLIVIPLVPFIKKILRIH